MQNHDETFEAGDIWKHQQPQGLAIILDNDTFVLKWSHTVANHWAQYPLTVHEKQGFIDAWTKINPKPSK